MRSIGPDTKDLPWSSDQEFKSLSESVYRMYYTVAKYCLGKSQ